MLPDKKKQHYAEGCPNFAGGYCTINFLWCPHFVEDNDLFVPKGCKNMVSHECTYYTEEEPHVLHT